MAKKRVILRLPKDGAYFDLREILSEDYLLEDTDGEEEALSLLNERQDDIAAIFFHAASESKAGFSLLKRLSSDMRFVAISVIAVDDNPASEYFSECINAGAGEFLVPPFEKELLLLRINNAIRSKDSATFHEIERMLKELPSNIYLKDREGKYVFATHYWHHLHMEGDPNWTIRGKTDVEIRKDKKNALKAMESDRVLLETGVGTSYIIEENDDGVQEFLELIKRPTHDDEGNVNGIIALINDVTETQLLKMELEKRSKTDALTGLLNKSATEELIRLVINNYLKEDGRGALMMIDADKFKTINDNFGHASGDRVLMAIGNIIHNSFKGMDVAGRIGGDEFMVFLRDIKQAEDVCRLAERIEYQVQHKFDGEQMEGYVSLSIGIALYPEHGKDFETLYQAADKALYEVKENGRASFKLYSE